MFFPILIQAATYLFMASPAIIVAVGVANLVSEYRFNKAMGK